MRMAGLAGSGGLLLKGLSSRSALRLAPSFLYCSLACRVGVAFELLESLVHLRRVFHLEYEVVVPIDARDVVLNRGSVEPGIDDLAQARVVGQLQSERFNRAYSRTLSRSASARGSSI